MSFIDKPRITAFSHSRLNTYEQCPRKAKYKFIQKLKEPSSTAAERGIDIHKQLEDYIKGEQDHLPDIVSDEALIGIMEALKEEGADTELQVAFDRNWEPCDWFGPQTFMRVVWDAISLNDEHALVVDHKTGKIYAEHKQQADLYALAAFRKYPDINEVTVAFLYIDQNIVGTYEFTREDLPELAQAIEERVRPAASDDVFAPTPSPKCRWCFFRNGNQGPCEFG